MHNWYDSCGTVTWKSYGYHGSTNREFKKTLKPDTNDAGAGHCKSFFCVVSMFLIYIGLQLLSAYVFGLALILLIASLGVSFREIQISTRSLEIYLGTMEKGKRNSSAISGELCFEYYIFIIGRYDSFYAIRHDMTRQGIMTVNRLPLPASD